MMMWHVRDPVRRERIVQIGVRKKRVISMPNVFRFETMLRVRKAREDERKRVVAARLRKIASLARERQVLEDQIRNQTETMREALARPQAEIVVLRWSRHWVGRLRRQVLATDAKIAEQRAILAHERAVLTDARKETKALDRLKERQYEAYLANERKRELLESDELNLARFLHARINTEDIDS